MTTQQLKDIAWQLRGTPAVEPIYRELGSRPKSIVIAPEDPQWTEKVNQILTEGSPS
ncbi:hypothetical protein NW813_10210 [Synechococcus sp. R55.6]|uniref:hypothetical protein n=1 Tax=unclassified Synechococcus TaxID=2626047 RepID=UPI0039C15A6D